MKMQLAQGSFESKAQKVIVRLLAKVISMKMVQFAVADLLMVIDQWGQVGGSADVNGDGYVDVSDLLAIVGNWGPCT